MQPTKEEIKLTPATVEALEKLNEKECPECKGRILLHRPCKKCDGTGKVGGWQWQPQVGEWFCHKKNIWLVLSLTMSGMIRTGDGLQNYRVSPEECTPILHWETIVEILESIGYDITVTYEGGEEVNRRGYCSIWKEGQYVVEDKRGKDCQEAVMRAVIALSKEMKKC